jgi:tRNA dimethylallyltransferase
MVHARALTARNPIVWYLMGPTASGKTDLALELTRRFPFEIVSVDSSLVYRGMDIGTAKPGAETLARSPHHLIDLRWPWETYSAAAFCRDAHAVISQIRERGHIPLLVGGTMFYFRALELGLPAGLPAANPEIRRALEGRAARCGWPQLHRELQAVDPDRAARIEPGDRQRIQRALEIAFSGRGASNSATHAPPERVGAQRLCKIALAPGDRSWLHRRIERRFDAMLHAGLVDEVRNLMENRAISTELPALKMVGYRQAVQYLSGEVGYNAMRRRSVAATRQLAKRQLTWLRNQSGVVWFDCMGHRLSDAVGDYVLAKLRASRQ